MKIIVHTKTGRKLSYYPKEWGNDLLTAKSWWLTAVKGSGETVIPVTNIDFVEFQ